MPKTGPGIFSPEQLWCFHLGHLALTADASLSLRQPPPSNLTQILLIPPPKQLHNPHSSHHPIVSTRVRAKKPPPLPSASFFFWTGNSFPIGWRRKRSPPKEVFLPGRSSLPWSLTTAASKLDSQPALLPPSIHTPLHCQEGCTKLPGWQCHFRAFLALG